MLGFQRLKVNKYLLRYTYDQTHFDFNCNLRSYIKDKTMDYANSEYEEENIDWIVTMTGTVSLQTLGDMPWFGQVSATLSAGFTWSNG